MDDTQRFDVTRYGHWIDDHVRFCDLDPLGHVNNNAIGQYFENARASFFTEVTPGWPHGDVIFVLGRTAIDFRRELHMPAALRIGTGVLKIGRTSLTLTNVVFNKKGMAMEGVAYGESVSVLIDKRTRSPIDIPSALRSILERYEKN